MRGYGANSMGEMAALKNQLSQALELLKEHQELKISQLEDLNALLLKDSISNGDPEDMQACREIKAELRSEFRSKLTPEGLRTFELFKCPESLRGIRGRLPSAYSGRKVLVVTSLNNLLGWANRNPLLSLAYWDANITHLVLPLEDAEKEISRFEESDKERNYSQSNGNWQSVLSASTWVRGASISSNPPERQAHKTSVALLPLSFSEESLKTALALHSSGMELTNAVKAAEKLG